MRAKISQVTFFVILLLAAYAVRAEQLRMVADHWPPYVDESLPGRGLAIDLVTTAFSRAGYDPRLTTESWSRALEGARIGVYDVVANIWYTDDRARDLDYSEPYLVNDIRLMKRKGSNIRYDRLDDLKGLLIGVVKDYAYPKDFASASQLIKISNDAILPALGELVKGQYDLVVGDKHVIDFTLGKFLPNDSENLEFLPKSVGQNKLYIAVSKANPQHKKIVQDFNRALRAMKKDGTYQRILNSHQFQP
jgi:polar amino acid transport system substrate-binding protein